MTRPKIQWGTHMLYSWGGVTVRITVVVQGFFGNVPLYLHTFFPKTISACEIICRNIHEK